MFPKIENALHKIKTKPLDFLRKSSFHLIMFLNIIKLQKEIRNLARLITIHLCPS